MTEAGSYCGMEDLAVDAVTPAVAETASTELSHLLTTRVGGPADDVVVARTEAELLEAVRSADTAQIPVLVLGGGSNTLVGDDGFRGRVVVVATRGLRAQVTSCGGALVTVAAGESWDAFVAFAVEHGWVGLEALSGIPGAVGSTPIQNVGAYGAEVAQYIASVRTWDRREDRQVTFASTECGFAYRDSRFKREPGRYVVLDVTFHVELGDLSAPVAYAELAGRLGVAQGERAPIQRVRDEVLAIRAGKGMVLDAADHDTWSTGSFFTNPILTTEQADALPEGAPRFPMADGRVKTSAAWLIDHAGFGKGYSLPGSGGRASLSTKHVLAITNRGSATTSDVLALRDAVVDGVRDAFGITLVPEPVIYEV